MHGCMEGVTVIELGHVVAVPSVAAILADWGANVIKVETPVVGDQTRGVTHLEGGKISNGIHYLFENMNRNKRGITLNLKSEQGREVMYRLIAGADVFLTNFQPQALENFRLTYKDVSSINPRLIYATLTGYGNKGPKKDKPGYDAAAFWAHSGIMDKVGGKNMAPRRQRPGMGDSVTALCMVSGIAAALFSRQNTGAGMELSFSLYNTAVWILKDDIQIALSSGAELPYSDIKKAGNPLWNVYQTKDGRWLEFVMLQADLFWSRFCHATGLHAIENDPRFASAEKRKENCEALISLISEVMLTKDLRQWEEIFESNGLFSSPVQTVTEVINDPHAIENDFFLEFDHPIVNRMKLVASPVLFNGKRPPIRSAAPVLGQHTEEILLEYGYTWDDIASLRDQSVL